MIRVENLRIQTHYYHVRIAHATQMTCCLTTIMNIFFYHFLVSASEVFTTISVPCLHQINRI